MIRIRTTDGSTLSASPAATDGINVVTSYVIASGGRRMISSAPYRTTSDPTLEWSCIQYDQNGRVTETAVFTGSSAPSTCSSTTNRTGLATVTYNADHTETSDPAGNERIEYHDPFGQIVQITEDPDTLAIDTVYEYDPLGNLMNVDQEGQDRDFTYSSLGRLLTAANPESGALTYTYNDNGSVDTITDAESRTTTYAYDALGRVTGMDYSDSTPDVTYGYYTSGAPKIGYLQSVSSSVATETFMSYDTLGRVLSHTQEIVGNPFDYSMAYTYRLDDSIETMTYPSGRELTYEVGDDAGRLTSVTDGTTTYVDLDGTISNYYDALGRAIRMDLGNGLYETHEFRPAGSPTKLRLGTSAGGSERLELSWNYSATADNGNVTSHVITHPGPTTYTQSFTYDALDRLASVSESGGFGRDYNYDAYGNRWMTNVSGIALANQEPGSDSNYSTSTNRLSIQSSTCDDAGNQTYYAPYTLSFDAENRVTGVGSGSNGNMYYAYDGDGRRVAKSWTPNGGSETITYFVYDIAGRVVAEYSDDTLPSRKTSYVLTDLLGSVRMVTDGSGDVDECYDYLPFGRIITDGTNGRSSVGCYPGSESGLTSDLDEKFTGQKREETELDYFIARFYSAEQGRFTSADLPFMDQHIGDPQSWNLYIYVRNNPLTLVDRNGFCADNAYYWDGATLVINCEDYYLMDDLYQLQAFVWQVAWEQFVMSMFTTSSIDLDGLRRAISLISPSQECQSALAVANKDMGAVARANRSYPELQEAGSRQGMDSRVLAAIGVRETGFRNIPEYGGGDGMGFFQIRVPLNASYREAFDLGWSADWTAGSFVRNRSTLASQHPHFNANQLLQATIASHNFSTSNISGNPETIDNNTTGDNYGGNVMELMSCF